MQSPAGEGSGRVSTVNPVSSSGGKVTAVNVAPVNGRGNSNVVDVQRANAGAGPGKGAAGGLTGQNSSLVRTGGVDPAVRGYSASKTPGDSGRRFSSAASFAPVSNAPAYRPPAPPPRWSNHDEGRWHHDRHGWWDPFWAPIFWFPPPAYYYRPVYYPWGPVCYYPAYSPIWYDEFAWHPRHGWSLSFSFGYASPVYCSSWTTVSYGYATRTVIVDPVPQYEWITLADEACAPHTTVVYRSAAAPVVVASSAPTVVNVPVQAFQPTLFQSEAMAGVMSWTDTPSIIVRSMLQETPAKRSDVAANYLGKVPAGGWDVGFEQERVVSGVHELWFRGLEMDNLGRRALIVLRPKGEVPHLYPGQRMTVTGRLSGLCVDDPMEPLGTLILDEGSIKF